MGVERYNITSAVLGVLAQRLVRQLCRHCRVPYYPTDQHTIELGLDLDHSREALEELRKVAETTVLGPGQIRPGAPPVGPIEGTPRADGLVFYRPAGCEACSQTGYRGRKGIYELMILDEPVRRAILEHDADAKKVQRVARGQGMRMLREDGARQVIAGVTSVEEVLAATHAGDA
jgi:general secretion pathway protein E